MIRRSPIAARRLAACFLAIAFLALTLATPAWGTEVRYRCQTSGDWHDACACDESPELVVATVTQTGCCDRVAFAQPDVTPTPTPDAPPVALGLAFPLPQASALYAPPPREPARETSTPIRGPPPRPGPAIYIEVCSLLL